MKYPQRFVIVSAASIVVLTMVLIRAVFAGEEVTFIRQIEAGAEPVDAVIAGSGEIFVLDRHKCEIIVFSSEGERLRHFASSGVDNGQFKSPRSLAIGRKGNIIVADTGNRRVQVFGPEGQFLYQLGNAGQAPGKFKEPVGVAVSPLGNIFVIDKTKKTIAEFTGDGIFLRETELPGRPQDVTVDRKDRVYVLLPEQKAMVTFAVDDALRRLEVLNWTEDIKDDLPGASSLAVDSRGDVYVLEARKQRLVKLNPGRQTRLSFGAPGAGVGQFDQPLGINMGQDDQIVVADSRNHRVQLFRVAGSERDALDPVTLAEQPRVEFESKLSVSSAIVDLDATPDQGVYALTEDFGMIWRVGEETEMLAVAQEEGLAFAQPQALDVRPDGSMVVTDTGHHQMTFLNADGSHKYQFGNKGKGNGQFNGLAGVAMNAEGYIYVADSNNHRIQVFNPEGIYLRSFGKKSENPDSPGVGTFDQPTDLAFDAQQQLYVLDSRNKRVQIFDQSDKLIRIVGGVHGPVRFDDPVDIAVDARNYLYVADRGSHAVKIFDPEGRPVLQFGSAGQGVGYFPSLTAIAATTERIYVADAASDELQIFRFLLEPEKKKDPQEDFFYFTRISDALNMENASEDLQKTMARKLTLEQTKKELTVKLNITADQFQNTVQIVEEVLLASGQLQLTMRLPKTLMSEARPVSEAP